MGETLRLLILEDHATDAELLERELRKGGVAFASKRVQTRPDFTDALTAFKPDLVFSDLRLPRFDGLSALKLAKELAPAVPVVMITGAADDEMVADLMKAGAADYVAKDHLARAVPALRGALELVRARAAQERAEEALRQSEKMAAVGLLLGGVAHELNNPLAGILGHAQLLLRDTPPGTQAHADVSVIEREAKRCKRLIRSLLAFGRKREHQLLPADLNALLLEMVELKSYDLRRASITLTLELAEGLPQVRVDSHQIQQVFLNLLNNAEHALEGAKGGLIRVATLREGEEVVLVVADNGPGIPLEIQARIFEPFFTTKEVGKGTGLGLSICTEIAREHKAALTLESRPGAGARFSLRLPAPHRAPIQELPKRGAGEGGRILVLDDEEDALRFMSRALEQAGWQVQAHARPPEALASLKAGGFDLVITDYHLGETNGMQFRREAVALRPELADRFILCTGGPHLEAVRPLADSGALPVLVKPFDLEEFDRVVQTFRRP